MDLKENNWAIDSTFTERQLHAGHRAGVRVRATMTRGSNSLPGTHCMFS